MPATTPDLDTVQSPVRILPHDEYVTDNEIVPDSLQSLLSTIRDSLKANYFAIGDAAALLIKEAEVQGFRNFRIKRNTGKDVFVTQDRVFQAVGHYCGKAGRTVRYYYETARFYPDAVREAFDILDFSMFVVARSFGPRWREVLEYAALNPAADSDSVRSIFLAEAAGDVSGSAPGDEEEGEIAPERATDIVGGLSRLLESLSGFLKRVRLSPETSTRAAHVLAEFRNLLTEIAVEMREQSRQ